MNMNQKMALLAGGTILFLSLSGCGCQHEWQEATCTAAKTCTKCGETEGEALGHQWAEATCTVPKTCSVCSTIEGEALGHQWAEATCIAPKTCSVCSTTEGEALGHNVSQWQETAATCAQEGSRTGVCDRCKETIIESIPVVAHTPGNWKTIDVGADTKDRTREQYCAVCGNKIATKTYQFYTYLEGRGWSDSGRKEPLYEGIIGFAVIPYTDVGLKKTDNFKNTPWQVPIYAQDKQFYVPAGTVEHKTEVLVISQQLEHEGYGAYSGYLLVERLDNGQQFYLDVGNFITNPYWNDDNLFDAVKEGYVIAEYHQVSDYYPVNSGNEKVELSDGTVVLATGKTGTYGRGGPDDDTNEIEAIVFKEWQYGYGGVDVFFNQKDLTIIY